METTCQLRFVTDFDSVDPAEQQAAQLAERTDGYPRAVIAKLAALADLLEMMRSVRGPGEAASQYQFFSQLQTMDLYVDPGRAPERSIRARTPEGVLDVRNMQHLCAPVFLTDFSVEPVRGVRGDEDFLYVVEVPDRQNQGASDWRVRVSERCGFPRWGDAVAEAFERAVWQFEGSLAEAAEMVTAGE